MRAGLASAPEAIDLAVLKRLAEDPALAISGAGPAQVQRLWETCQLPDFRQQGVKCTRRFVARLWNDLAMATSEPILPPPGSPSWTRWRAISNSLQGRLAAIRSWAYICQRPDWVLARDEMAARARAVEARLSDALHQRLTERFVNRRTSVLMKSMGKDAGSVAGKAGNNGAVTVEGQPDRSARRIPLRGGTRMPVSEDRKLLLAAAERHMPQLLAPNARSSW